MAVKLIIVIAALDMPALAETEAESDADVVALFEQCDGDTAARLRFLEQALEEDRNYARYYFGGWLGFYTIGLGVTSWNAAHDEGERAIQVLSGIKALFGIGRMLYAPPNAKEGADASRAIAVNNEEQCRRRLEVAEQTLRYNTKQSQQKWGWKPHVFNLALHSAGAVVVAETWGARRAAWESAVIGMVVGETIIFSFPWHANEDLEEYERRFPPTGLPPGPKVSWGLAPTLGGASFFLRF
jgi:hypothetical protein